MAQPTLLQIYGPVGNLETLDLPAQGTERGVAVINHPNPTQGGTFTNNVIQTAAKCLAQMGFHCYLPNLRGTGNSAGQYSEGKGETDDCIAVIDHARAQHPQAASPSQASRSAATLPISPPKRAVPTSCCSSAPPSTTTPYPRHPRPTCKKPSSSTAKKTKWWTSPSRWHGAPRKICR